MFPSEMVTRSGATGCIFIKSNKAGVCVCVCVCARAHVHMCVHARVCACVLKAEGGAVRIFSDEIEGEILAPPALDQDISCHTRKQQNNNKYL